MATEYSHSPKSHGFIRQIIKFQAGNVTILRYGDLPHRAIMLFSFTVSQQYLLYCPRMNGGRDDALLIRNA